MDVKQQKTRSDRQTTFSQPAAPVKQEPEAPTVPASKKRKVSKKIIITLVVILLVVSVIIWMISRNNEESSQVTDGPSYTTILPENRTISSLGGWQQVSPPEIKPATYAYNDTIDDVKIIVSEQPLPEKFASSTDNHITKLAQGYNATKKLKSGNTTYYVGSSSKGPQSVIFTKEDLLVFIKSEKEVADDSWSAYIKSLSSSNLDSIPKY